MDIVENVEVNTNHGTMLAYFFLANDKIYVPRSSDECSSLPWLLRAETIRKM
jgi:hypothetical protein